MSDDDMISKLYDRLETTIRERDALTSRLEAAEKEKEASDLADDLWHAAEVRGIAMWREAHPGKELNLPDAAQYTFWLIHELEETRAARDAATAEAERLRKGRDEYERQIASRDRTIRADSAALASVTAEAERLRGTLTYIAEQARLNYPTVLSVIRVNAKAALNDKFQKAVADARSIINGPPTPAPSKEGDGE